MVKVALHLTLESFQFWIQCPVFYKKNVLSEEYNAKKQTSTVKREKIEMNTKSGCKEKKRRFSLLKLNTVSCNTLRERRSVTYAYRCVAASFSTLYFFQLNRKNYTL